MARTPDRVEDLLDNMRSCLGVRIMDGGLVYVYQGSPFSYEPCMYDKSDLQTALDSGRAKRQTLVVHTSGMADSTVEIIVAAGKKD